MKNAPLVESWGLGTALVLEQEVVRLFLFSMRFSCLYFFSFSGFTFSGGKGKIVARFGFGQRGP
jgi:hypothetical protein